MSCKDLTGQRFGRLVVLSREGSKIYANGRKRSTWLCQCDCGNSVVATGHDLCRGMKKSCGCLRYEVLNEGRKRGSEISRIDLSGKTFGRLTVICRDSEWSQNDTTWRCLCSCGNECIVKGRNLREGHTRSCGCLHKDVMADCPNHITHGGTKNRHWERLYVIWQNMKARCEKTYATSYPRYGGRGISICKEWHDYTTFRTWALEHGYADDLTIDRIDANGNYEPHNCRWATYKEQAQNKRATTVS